MFSAALYARRGFFVLSHEIAGAARIRHSLRPLLRGREVTANSAVIARREATKHIRVFELARYPVIAVSLRSNQMTRAYWVRPTSTTVGVALSRATLPHNSAGCSAMIASPTAMLPPVVTSA